MLVQASPRHSGSGIKGCMLSTKQLHDGFAVFHSAFDVLLVQEFSKSLGQVVDIVVSHQGLPLKMLLVSRLMATLVLPAPEHYRPLLRRFAALGSYLPSLAYPVLRSTVVAFALACTAKHLAVWTHLAQEILAGSRYIIPYH